jgi:hypothetical protein
MYYREEDVPLTIQQCIVPNCTKMQAPIKRGLCMMCYNKANKLVTLGTTTWEALEAMGLANPQDNDPFTQAFNEKNQS